jgi:hypothetical protein
MSRLLVADVFSARVGLGICPSLVRPKHVTRAAAFIVETLGGGFSVSS